jgi:glycerol uptake facilitator protein
VHEPTLARACAAEATGTFLLVLFGTGAVFVAVLCGALQGLLEVALVWGVGVALAIYAAGAISGAHLNPAVTLAAAVYSRFPRRRVAPYVAAQTAGAFAASAVLYALFCNVLADFEQSRGIVRGAPGSELSAMVFGEYFPNPAMFGTGPEAFAKVTHVQAVTAEVLGTALLVFFVFALTDPHNRLRPARAFAAPFIGLAVAVIIVVIAPLTQACLNPARDFGPRLFAFAVGFGEIAIPGPRGGFLTVYVLAPLFGGLLGGGSFQLLFHGVAAHAAPLRQPVQPTSERVRGRER